MAVAFDTLRAATQLQEAGFREPQAHALVTILAEVASETPGQRSNSTNANPRWGRVATSGEYGERISAECAALCAEMRVMKRDIIIALGSLCIALTGLAIAATSVLG